MMFARSRGDPSEPSDAVTTAPAKRSWLAGRLAEQPFLVFAVYVLVGGLALVALSWQHSKEIRETTTLKAAEAYSDAVTTMRNFYSRHVVPRAKKAGATVSHDYLTNDTSIPFPATLTIDLANQLKRDTRAFHFNFYSAQPFPWRSGRELDAFEVAALESIVSGETGRYVRYENYNDRRSVRVATPVVMGKDCVACHNSHPESPSRDWKIGDIRGVQQITMPIPNVGASFLPDIRKSAIYVAIFAAIGLCLIGLLMRELQHRIAETKSLATAAEQKNVELAAAKRDADLANRAQGAMISNVGHELRTPLNSIIGFSEIIKDERVGPLGHDDYREFAQEIHGGGVRLLEVINAILTISQLESGTYDLQQEPVDLNRLIAECRDSLAEAAAGREIELDASCPEELPQVMFDRRSIRRILENVGRNAIKFTRPGGRVEIGAESTANGDIVVSVSDNGIGIARQRLEEIMKPFRQGNGSHDRQYEGVGLGLSMALSIARLHDSNLHVESVEGDGTTVTLTIPRSRIVLREARPGIRDAA